MSLTGALSSAISALNAREPVARNDFRQHLECRHHGLQDHIGDVRGPECGASSSATSYTSGGVTVFGPRQHHAAGVAGRRTTNSTDVGTMAALLRRDRCQVRRIDLLYPQLRVSRPTTRATWSTTAITSKAGAPMPMATSSAMRRRRAWGRSTPRWLRPAVAPRTQDDGGSEPAAGCAVNDKFTSSMTVVRSSRNRELDPDHLGKDRRQQLDRRAATDARLTRPRRPARPAARSRSPSTRMSSARLDDARAWPTLSVSRWTDGAANSSIALNLDGTARLMV